MKKHILALSIVSALSLTACSGGGDSSTSTSPGSENKTTHTGTFVDSAVAGLTFKCGETTGITAADGQFTYRNGEQCEFRIGNFLVGKTQAMTGEGSAIITPYDVTDNVDQAIKLAALLQTIDADGDAENGITLLVELVANLPASVLGLTEQEFYQAVEQATGKKAVSLAQAKGHMDKSLGQAKGYHSKAVETVIADARAVADAMEEVNFEEKLAYYQSVLDQGDQSNKDIASLKALIGIFEVVNDPAVAARISVTDSQFSYVDMLPKLLGLLKNTATLSPAAGGITGTTDDTADVLYALAERLVVLSDALAMSFSDKTYVAVYSKDLSLDYNQAQSIRGGALTLASMLSTFAAYNAGSDAFFVPQTASGELDTYITNWSISGGSVITGSVTTGKMQIDSEYLLAEVDPVSFLLDDQVGTLRSDAKYLTTAKQALVKAAEIGKMVDNSELELAEQDQSDINAVFAHLTAKDGAKAPFTFVDESATYTLNLHAFYDISTAIDRSDFTITSSYICNRGEYNQVQSQLLNEPVCLDGDVLTDQDRLDYSELIYLDWSDNVSIYTQASPAKINTQVSPNAGGDVEQVILSCTPVQGHEDACL